MFDRILYKMKIRSHFLSLLAAACLLVSAAPARAQVRAYQAGQMGFAQIYPDIAKVFLRVRTGGGHKTPYGLFVLDRETGVWETIGTAADFGRPVTWDDSRIDPDMLFFSRQAYASIELGNNSYTVGWKDGRVAVEISGMEQDEITSDPMPFSEGQRREYLFKYVQGTALWFDLRVRENMLFSEGVGFFDTVAKTLTIFSPEQLGFRLSNTLVTRMSGYKGRVLLGVSFCDKTTCLDNGAVIALSRDGSEPEIFTSENSALPGGAVLELLPDGDDIWVATSQGIARWRPDMQQVAIYRPADTATVVGAPPLQLCAESRPADELTLADGGSVHIQQVVNKGFLVSVDQELSGWTGVTEEDSGVSFEDDGATLVLAPGAKASFYTSPDETSALMGDLEPAGYSARLPVLDRNGNWVRADLSGHVWIPAEHIAVSMVAAQDPQ